MPKYANSTTSLVSRMRLSKEEHSYYMKLFQNFDFNNEGVIHGSVAGDFFRTCGLSDELLFGIWGVGDPDDTGQIDFGGFLICCRLIAFAQSRGPNCIAPGGDYSSENIEKTKLFYKDPRVLARFEQEQDDIYALDDNDFENYKRLFIRLDPDGDGFITGEDARRFYLNYTQLSIDELMQLWSLADVSFDGRLSYLEFCVMQQLVKIVSTKDEAIPQQLPQSLAAILSEDAPAAPIVQAAPTTIVGPYVSDAINIDPLNAETPRFLNSPPAKPQSTLTRPQSSLGAVDPPQNLALHRGVGATKTTDRTTASQNLLNAAESLIAKLKGAIEEERRNFASQRGTRGELESKLQTETDALDLLASEYRALRGNSESLILETSILKEKLQLIQKQAEDLRLDIAQLKSQNVALSGAFETNEGNLSKLSETRQDLAKQNRDEIELLKLEERQLNALKNTLDQLRLEKQHLHSQNNTLRERLEHSENVTNTMLRAIEKEQGSIASVRSERIKTLQQRIHLTEALSQSGTYSDIDGIGTTKNIITSQPSQPCQPPSYSDPKGIRVAQPRAVLEAPGPRRAPKEGQTFPG
ncbi:bifunctional EF-hand domain pair/EF-hand domain/EH domain [Babesia duncani]|uniref:Bifunctional EF-hand domain pair/EF-hand domain/EH domain n=1 Tax=Babesia duncani TaxID=323732 RepID=A0AAD9UQE6_9APIC|nr:bifunctional EF-hand domain pair/EF-hand domain/EH domain [Babesia duncani]